MGLEANDNFEEVNTNKKPDTINATTHVDQMMDQVKQEEENGKLEKAKRDGIKAAINNWDASYGIEFEEGDINEKSKEGAFSVDTDNNRIIIKIRKDATIQDVENYIKDYKFAAAYANSEAH